MASIGRSIMDAGLAVAHKATTVGVKAVYGSRLGDITDKGMTVARGYQISRDLSMVGDDMVRSITSLEGLVRKAAQQLCTRPDVVPVEIRVKLQSLLADGPPRDVKDIERQVRSNLKRCGGQLQVQHPLKTGTVGDVSLVSLHDLKYALKTISKEQRDKYKEDFGIFQTSLLGSLHALFGLLESVNPEAGSVRTIITNLIDLFKDPEIEESIMHEFRLDLEAENLRKADAMVGSIPSQCKFVVPRVLEVSEDGDCLVMDYLDGSNLQDKVPPNSEVVVKDLLGLFVHSLLRRDGGSFLHADLHPGNILILAGGEIALVDWGKVVQVPHEHIDLVREILLHIHQEGAKSSGAWVWKALQRLGGTLKPGHESAHDEELCYNPAMLDLAGARGGLDIDRILKSNEKFALPAWVKDWQKATSALVVTLAKLGVPDDLESYLCTLLQPDSDSDCPPAKRQRTQG